MRRLRVLQVLYHFTVGGIEKWLLDALRQLPPDEFAFDFLVHGQCDHPALDEITQAGGRVWPMIRPTHPWRYMWELQRHLQEYGPFDIVHAHVPFAGLVMHAARQAGVRGRISHSHASPAGFRDGRLHQRLGVAFTNWLYLKDATTQLACSELAALGMYGSRWRGRVEVLKNGIDLTPFAADVDRAALRRELGLPDQAWVIGHVGRFTAEKNQAWLVKVFAEVRRLEPTAHLLLVGDGPLLPEVQAAAGPQVHFAGTRADVPRLLVGAMDTFVLPSKFESFGLAALEAQAAGLPCVLSDGVGDEVIVEPALVRRVSLRDSPSDWAQMLLECKTLGGPGKRAAVLARLRESPFNIVNSAARLRALFRETCNAV